MDAENTMLFGKRQILVNMVRMMFCSFASPSLFRRAHNACLGDDGITGRARSCELYAQTFVCVNIVILNRFKALDSVSLSIYTDNGAFYAQRSRTFSQH